MQPQIQDERDRGQKVGLLPVLVLILLILFLPSVFIVGGLFAITYFSSYNRRWWLGLAIWGLVMICFHFTGIPILDAYKLYLTEFGTTIWDSIGSDIGVAAAVVNFWRINIVFVAVNGFGIGGLISAIFYFVGFDIRDLRQQKIRAWKKSLGFWGPSHKQIRSEKSRRAAGLSNLKHPTDGTLIGLEGRKKVVVTDQEANGHILLLGATGAGKTTSLLNFVESAAQRELPAIVVDAKGDPELVERVQNIAGRFNRVFRVFSTRPESSMTYDPLRHGNALELTDKIMAASDWTEPHYMHQSQRYLQIAFSILLAAGRRPSLETIADDISGTRLNAALRSMDDETAAKMEKYVRAMSDEESGMGDTPGGLYNRLAVWSSNELSHLFAADPGGLDLVHAVENAEIAIFSLDSLRYPDFARMLGRLITIDLKALVSRVYENKSKIYVALDEFGAFANMHVADFINKSRGAGFHIIVSTQELIDLDMAVPGLSDLILGNTNIKIIQRQDVPKSAELLAEAIGTFDDVTLTHRLAHGEGSGMGTLTSERAFLVHTDQIKRLGIGQAYISVKVPNFCVSKVSVRKIREGGIKDENCNRDRVFSDIRKFSNFLQKR